MPDTISYPELSRHKNKSLCVELFDKLLKCLDKYGYKCTFHVMLVGYYDKLYDETYRVYHVVQYKFIKKELEDFKALSTPTDANFPPCLRLNSFLYDFRSINMTYEEINQNRLTYEKFGYNSYLCGQYQCIDLKNLLTMIKLTKRYFCTLLISDILAYGVSIYGWKTDHLAFVDKIIKPLMTLEEALIDIDMLVP